jgi:hypothetical protein
MAFSMLTRTQATCSSTPWLLAHNRAVDWELTFVDFGMVGHVPAASACAMLIGVGRAMPRGFSLQQMNLLLPDADLALIERATSRPRSPGQEHGRADNGQLR